VTGFYEGTDGQQVPVDHDLDQHTDVKIDTPLVGQTIVYDDVDGLFKNNKADLSLNVIANIGDVSDSISPSTNEVLAWSGSIWTNAGVSPGPVAMDGISDVTAPTPAVGDVLNWDGGAWVNTPLFGNDFLIGDGLAKTSFILDSGAGFLGTIEFQEAGAPLWNIEKATNGTDLVIRDASRTLAFTNTVSGLTWDDNVTITGASTLDIPSGFLTCSGADTGAYLQLATPGTNVGVFIGGTPGTSTTFLKTLAAAPGPLVLSHFNDLKLRSDTEHTTSSYIDFTYGGGGVSDKLEFSIEHRSLAESTMVLDEDGLNSRYGFETGLGSFVIPDTNTSGKFVCPNQANQPHQLPNLEQVEQLIADAIA
jgi:hypothetical protein